MSLDLRQLLNPGSRSFSHEFLALPKATISNMIATVFLAVLGFYFLPKLEQIKTKNQKKNNFYLFFIVLLELLHHKRWSAEINYLKRNHTSARKYLSGNCSLPLCTDTFGIVSVSNRVSEFALISRLFIFLQSQKLSAV